MWVVLKVGQVMVTMRPASAASEAVTSYGLFRVSKNIEGSIFRSRDRIYAAKVKLKGGSLWPLRPWRLLRP